MLKQAQRPVVITGTGVFWSGAMAELKEFVELSGIPFYTTPQGRGVIAEDHPLSFLGARNQAWKQADAGPGRRHAAQLHHWLRPAAAMGARR